MSTDIEAFTTHKNYAHCLRSLTNELILDYKNTLEKKPLPYLDTKDNLIKLTKKSLQDEFSIVKLDSDYAYASTAWLPIKSYHVIYNLLLKIAYIITLDKRCFNWSHAECGRYFTRLLAEKVLQFNRPSLNQVFDHSILEFHEKAGANLTIKTPIQTMYKLAIKKVATYKYDRWKNNKNFRMKKNKDEKVKYLQNFSISFFEFPLYMRHRSHYRDFAFMDGVPSEATVRYFEHYYYFTVNVYNALVTLVEKLVTQRSNG